MKEFQISYPKQSKDFNKLDLLAQNYNKTLKPELMQEEKDFKTD